MRVWLTSERSKVTMVRVKYCLADNISKRYKRMRTKLGGWVEYITIKIC